MNNTQEVCVTVIMPVYNAAKYLDLSIQCLIGQDCGRWRLICVDDGSADESQSVIRGYAEKDTRIKLVCQPNFPVFALRGMERENEICSNTFGISSHRPNFIDKDVLAQLVV